jgi:hypothetical protein
MLRLARQVKERQAEEAKVALEGLGKTRAVTEFRYNFYKNIEHRNTREEEHLKRLDAAQRHQVAALLPDVHIGVAGVSSPFSVGEYGGINLAQSLQAASRGLAFLASLETYQANRAATLGRTAKVFERRQVRELIRREPRPAHPCALPQQSLQRAGTAGYSGP